MRRYFIFEDSGNIAVIFALMAPVILGFAGAGFDYARYINYRAKLSEVSDLAALAGAREYMISTSGGPAAERRAEQVAGAALNEINGIQIVSVGAFADDTEKNLRVSITAFYEPSMLVGIFERPLTLEVSSLAQVKGASNLCVIGLNERDGDTVSLDDNAKIIGPDCTVYSNSTHTNGMRSTSQAVLEAGFICSAGGYDGSVRNFMPTPLMDCPKMPDPIAGRPEPSLGACDYVDHAVDSYDGYLEPGVYCGGLTIDGVSNVELRPGVYEMRDGDFLVKKVSRITGAGVGLYFSGDSATLKFEDNARIDLTAPVTGDMAGLLFWRSASATGANVYEIESNFVDRLVGTIYLPGGTLSVGATSEVAEESEYTVIVADKIDLRRVSKLVLNTDYELSPVPLPGGVGPIAADIYLRE